MTKSTHPHICALLRNSSRLALTAGDRLGGRPFGGARRPPPRRPRTPRPPLPTTTVIEEVVVTGYRASLRSAMETKKTSDVMLDAINAEDIADFPDSNLAESLQRLPGISIDRDNGEGRTISVRGLSGDFSRVRVNNMEAVLSTGANNDAGSSPNRSRASTSTPSLRTLQLGAGAQVVVGRSRRRSRWARQSTSITGKPFDYKNGAFAASAEDLATRTARPTARASPCWRRIAGSTARLACWSRRPTPSASPWTTTTRAGGGSADYTYRGSTWTGDELPGRAGFAAPTGTVFTSPDPAAPPAPRGPRSPPTKPIRPTTTIRWPIRTPTPPMTGSDPAAYAKLYPNCAATAGQPVAALTPTTSAATTRWSVSQPCRH